MILMDIIIAVATIIVIIAMAFALAMAVGALFASMLSSQIDQEQELYDDN